MAKNMFALYLVHGPVLHVVGYGLPHAVWGVIGKGTGWEWYAGIVVGWAVSLVLCVGVADVFTREVDGRCAGFVKWLDGGCVVRKT